jgi:hypothetical protein
MVRFDAGVDAAPRITGAVAASADQADLFQHNPGSVTFVTSQRARARL